VNASKFINIDDVIIVKDFKSGCLLVAPKVPSDEG